MYIKGNFLAEVTFLAKVTFKGRKAGLTRIAKSYFFVLFLHPFLLLLCRLFQMEEDAKDHEKTKEKLQLADGKNQKIVTINKEYENKLREIELR